MTPTKHQGGSAKVVLITGAAHGIGLSLAKLYDKIGAQVLIVDVNQSHLQDAQQKLPHQHCFTCDVSDIAQVHILSEKILGQFGAPDILINNAGIVEKSNFLDCEDAVLERTLRVNVLSHFWMLKAFLPAMIKRQTGHICEIASAAGLLGVPGMVAYCASKHAVMGLADSLRMELEEMADVHIPVTVVCPSFVNTGMFAGVRPPRFTPLLDQEQIARLVFQAIDRKQERLLAPFMVKLLPLMKLLPNRLFRVVAKFFHVHHAMKDILSPGERRKP